MVVILLKSLWKNIVPTPSQSYHGCRVAIRLSLLGCCYGVFYLKKLSSTRVFELEP